MPKRYPPEFRRKVLDLVTAGRRVAQVAADIDISEQCIYTWRRQQQIDLGLISGTTTSDNADLVRGAPADRQARDRGRDPPPSRRAAQGRDQPKDVTVGGHHGDRLRTVISSLHARHRAIEFKKFLQKIDKEVPVEYAMHVMLDNASTHKTPAVKRWLLAHPRFAVHFTPTSSSLLNLVERWSGELTTKKLQRGTHRSVQALNADIRDWITTWNQNPRSFVWTKTADQILDSIARYCARINDSAWIHRRTSGDRFSVCC